MNAIFEATKNKGVLFGKGGLNGNVGFFITLIENIENGFFNF